MRLLLRSFVAVAVATAVAAAHAASAEQPIRSGVSLLPAGCSTCLVACAVATDPGAAALRTELAVPKGTPKSN